MQTTTTSTTVTRKELDGGQSSSNHLRTQDSIANIRVVNQELQHQESCGSGLFLQQNQQLHDEH